MKYLAVLGRQPDLSLAELSAQFGDSVRQISPELAIFETSDTPDINRLGGTLKLARLLPGSLTDYLRDLPDGKITLGLSDYSKNTSVKSVRLEAMKLKKILKRHGRSIRILENRAPALSTATSHHNQLSEKPNHIEIILVGKEKYLLTGVQNITAYARRDQARPARDAKVGMLPPKLAQILINLCGPLEPNSRILDPFCGTGVLLQEALLMGYTVVGTDLNERMISYSERNLEWLSTTEKWTLSVGDATNCRWDNVDAVACETYLGPPMSTPPSEIKLKSAKHECREIIFGFLKNLAPQIKNNTPVVLAVPAWLRPNGRYSTLNILDEIKNMGYNVIKYNNSSRGPLLYHREGQIVAREIIVLRKK